VEINEIQATQSGLAVIVCQCSLLFVSFENVEKCHTEYMYYLCIYHCSITSEINCEMSKPVSRLKYAPSASTIETTASIFCAFYALSTVLLSLWSDLIRTFEKHHLTSSETSMITLPESMSLSSSLTGIFILDSDILNGYVGSPALVADIANCVAFHLSYATDSI